MARTDSPPLNLGQIPPAGHGTGAQGRPSMVATSARGRLVGGILAFRQPLPWAGKVGIPLAVTAVILTGSWWALVPLMACAWLCTPGSWAWECLIAVETGLLGAIWAVLGAYALAAWPSHRPMVGAVWAITAAVIAAIAFLRRRTDRS